MQNIYLAGIGNSGPQHWQAIWRSQDEDGLWVEHADWDIVARETWVEETRRALEPVKGPAVFIAHSLGCLLAAEYLSQHGAGPIVGALLVAVPDVTGPSFPREATGFRRAIELRMPVPSIVVASSDDPYGSLEHARQVAAHWQSELKHAGMAGHINADSKLAAWSEGRVMLEQLISGRTRRETFPRR